MGTRWANSLVCCATPTSAGPAAPADAPSLTSNSQMSSTICSIASSSSLARVIVATGLLDLFAFVVQVHDRQVQLPQPRLDDQPVADHHDLQGLGIDALHRHPVHVVQR